MSRTFEIVDGSRRGAAPCATLVYDEGTRSFEIDIAEDAGLDDLPLILAGLAERGKRQIGPEWSLRWVQERIVPPSRQNLGQVLRACGLDHYDELALLIAGEGRCSQDDFFIREVMSSDATPSQTAAEQLGAQLAAARRAHGLTQKELSVMSGVQQAVISRIEGGTSNPTVTLLSTLAETLDMHLELVADQDSAARPK